MQIVKKHLVALGIVLLMVFALNFYGIEIKASKNLKFLVITLPVDVFCFNEFRQVNIWVLKLSNSMECLQVSTQLRRDYRTCYWGADSELWIDGDVGIIFYQYEKGVWNEYPVIGVDNEKIVCKSENEPKTINLDAAPKEVVKRLMCE